MEVLKIVHAKIELRLNIAYPGKFQDNVAVMICVRQRIILIVSATILLVLKLLAGLTNNSE